MSISILPDDVISQIAAGEVVERPASVVKELIENALDAQARNIHIDVAGGGQRRIRVSDDGEGIVAEEVQLALTRHATSKLRTAADLQHIQTLGFRGEALASIASVSSVTVITRHRDEDIGVQVRVEGGRLVQHKPIGAPAGTMITVENLFFNTPARLKFMKSENTEKRNIATVIMNYAMAYPQVKFVLVQDGREAFRSPGQGQLADVVVNVFGLETFRKMIEVQAHEHIREAGVEISVRGYISQPEISRKDRTRIVLFVNGRAVQDAGLSYAITQAYHSLMEKGRHPLAVLMLEVPSDFVDVNVHPTKAEVRFQDTNTVFAALQRAVRQAVLGQKQTSLHLGYGQPTGEKNLWQDAGRYDLRRQDRLASFISNQTENEAAPDVTDDDLDSIPEGPERPAKPRTLPLLRVVGQIGASYIIAEGPAGMYLIDQHAAHTRILFQEFLEMQQQGTKIPVQVLDSVTIQVNAQDAQLIDLHHQLLAESGFLLELFGVNVYLIRTIPQMLRSGDPAQHVWIMLESLRTKSTADLSRQLLIQLAELAAVKSGQILSLEDMRDLIRRLERCPEPQHSPTGQTVLIHMSAQQLEREFNRRPS